MTTIRDIYIKLEALDKTISKLRHAANCALWLLEQPELTHLINSDWGDPIAIRDMLIKVGCKPSCKSLI